MPITVTATKRGGASSFCGILFPQRQMEFHFLQILCRACAAFGHESNTGIHSRWSIANRT